MCLTSHWLRSVILTKAIVLKWMGANKNSIPSSKPGNVANGMLSYDTVFVTENIKGN